MDPIKFYIRFAEPYMLDGVRFRPGEVAQVDFQMARVGQEPGFVVYVRTQGKRKLKERCLSLPRFDDLFAGGICRAMDRREYEVNRYAERNQGIIEL